MKVIIGLVIVLISLGMMFFSRNPYNSTVFILGIYTFIIGIVIIAARFKKWVEN